MQRRTSGRLDGHLDRLVRAPTCRAWPGLAHDRTLCSLACRCPGPFCRCAWLFLVLACWCHFRPCSSALAVVQLGTCHDGVPCGRSLVLAFRCGIGHCALGGSRGSFLVHVASCGPCRLWPRCRRWVNLCRPCPRRQVLDWFCPRAQCCGCIVGGALLPLGSIRLLSGSDVRSDVTGAPPMLFVVLGCACCLRPMPGGSTGLLGSAFPGRVCAMGRALGCDLQLCVILGFFCFLRPGAHASLWILFGPRAAAGCADPVHGGRCPCSRSLMQPHRACARCWRRL